MTNVRQTDPNRTAIYNNEVQSARVISAPNGLWTPQKRVTHTGGCSRGYYRAEVEGFEAGVVTRYDNYPKVMGLSKRKRRRALRDFPHSDPWRDIHAPSDRTTAIMTAFGPKYQGKIV